MTNISEIYERLGIDESDHLSIAYDGGGWDTSIVTLETAIASAPNLPGNAYFGVNPVTLPVGTRGKRGSEDDIARVVALYADIDVKPGACPNLDMAHQIINELASILHERPVVIIESGGGLQPIWALESCDQPTGRALLHRFGRLVRVVAEAQHIKLDSVFDTARVLRVPGSYNQKYDPPREVTLFLDSGAPMLPFAVGEWLSEVGIDERDDDTTILGDVVSAPDGWTYGKPCGYAKKAIEQWPTDTPLNGDRHPKMVSQCVRLACMWRAGCLPDKQSVDAALAVIATRHETSCATVGIPRSLKRYEIENAWQWAVGQVARFTDEKVRAELGNHDHQGHTAKDRPEPRMLAAPTVAGDSEPSTPAPQPDSDLVAIEQGFWASRESLRLIYDASLAGMASPWAVLGCCAAKALTQVRPHVTLPALIGGPGSLNWFVAIAAASGGGKGAANAVARRLIPTDITVRNVGSGEGMINAYRDKDSETGWREGILFNVDEVDTLTALGNRSGSTMMGILRSAFSGEELGFAYVARGGEHLKAHSYRLTLVVGVQPARAGGLMADSGGGTPQRFMWFPGSDPRITADPPWSGSETLALPHHSEWRYPTEIRMPDYVSRFVRENRAREQRGEVDVLDTHAVFVREKFAFALAVLDGRHTITEEDWELSGIAAAVSDRTRDWVRAELARADDAEAAELGRRYGVRAEAAGAEKVYQEQRRHNRITLWTLDKLKAAGAEGILAGRLAEMGSSRDRPYLADILAALQSDGLAGAEDVTRGGQRWRIVL
jgi:hypothetical protein